MSAISARSHDLQNLHAGMRHRRRQGTHRIGTAGDFINCLRLRRLGREGGKECRILRRRRLSAHDLEHRCPGLLIGQIFLVHNFDDRFLNHDVSSPFRKFCKIFLPSGVMIDSG